MIHVEPQPEPNSFNDLVRKPGLRFLSNYPNPTAKQWKTHSYWTKIAQEQHSAYNGICCYSCHFIQYDTGWRTVEHFKPKDVNIEDAYEWSNYRLACGVLNGRKGTKQVLDPFHIQNGWFIMDFPSLLVKPASYLSDREKQEVRSTCQILGLNDEGTCMTSRQRYLKDYCNNAITFDYLRYNAPFIASELLRQNLIEEIKNIMIYG